MIKGQRLDDPDYKGSVNAMSLNQASGKIGAYGIIWMTN